MRNCAASANDSLEQLRLTLPLGSRSRNQYTCKTTHTDRWSLSILVRHRRLRKQIEEQVDQENAIFTGTLTITPTSQEVVRKQSLRLTASLQQKVQYEGYYSLKPTLSFSAVLPVNSEVFKMAKDGNVEGLMKLLQDGEASLSDCDTAGRQLLHVSLCPVRKEIVTLLIGDSMLVLEANRLCASSY